MPETAHAKDAWLRESVIATPDTDSALKLSCVWMSSFSFQ